MSQDKKPETIRGEKPKAPSESRTEAQAEDQAEKPEAGLQAAPYINLLQDAMFRAFVSRDERLLRSIADAFIFLPKGKNIQSLTIKDKGGKEWVRETLAALKDSSRPPRFPGGKLFGGPSR